ncbi:MAG: DUF3368 domain-containing protein [Coleofasciculaceae cyanobacterium SM2_1_6]|nr:DUF3368 domain-containing protein [Coleofasciculaceae cyanobacterium SM2_1_6]
MIIVSDTSVITNLAAIEQLELIHQLYTTIIIPVAVYNEMVAVDKLVPGAIEVQTLSWIRTQAVANIQGVIDIQTSEDNIDLGEAEAIILALELKAELILMDERRGRALAATYGLKVTGLLGILLQSKRQGLLSLVKPVMDRLIGEADFRISNDLYTTVLRNAGE